MSRINSRTDENSFCNVHFYVQLSSYWHSLLLFNLFLESFPSFPSGIFPSFQSVLSIYQMLSPPPHSPPRAEQPGSNWAT
jgi:hypothetical protein